MNLPWSGWSPRRKRMALIFIAVALVGTLVVSTLTGPERQLSAYGDDTRDASRVRTALAADGYPTGNIQTSPHLLGGVENPSRYAVLVLGVEEAYRSSEVDAIEAFVRDGGRVVLADDFGSGNSVANRFGVSFDGVVLSDDDFAGNRSFVAVNATLGDRSFRVVTNVPTSLSVAPDADATVIARTSPNAYIDLNGNGRSDDADTEGPFPVAVQVEAGDGVIVFVSDPGIFTNAVMDMDGARNDAFIRDLVFTLLPQGGTVVFDESRHRAPLGTGMVRGAGTAAVLGTQDPILGSVAFITLVGGALLGLLLLERPEDFRVHRQDLDSVHIPSDRPDLMGWRLQRLALQEVMRHHEIPDHVQDKRARAVEAAGDPRIRELLEAEDPSVNRTRAESLLARIRAYGSEVDAASSPTGTQDADNTREVTT